MFNRYECLCRTTVDNFHDIFVFYSAGLDFLSISYRPHEIMDFCLRFSMFNGYECLCRIPQITFMIFFSLLGWVRFMDFLPPILNV